MKPKWPWLWTVLLLMMLCSLGAAVAEETTGSVPRIWQVSPERLSLTDALAACEEGDRIELASGIYDDSKESFPLTVTKSVTISGEDGTVIDAPAFMAAFRTEAEGIHLENLTIDFRRTGIYAIGDHLTIRNCQFRLADIAWRTSSCGIWAGGIMGMNVQNCHFTGCGISLAGPPISESSAGKPVLTGLFEVGEKREYFTTHVISGCTVNGKPLFYAKNQQTVTIPADAGEAICCGCGTVIGEGIDVSDGSMGMELVYNEDVQLTDCRADRCGVFGLYVAKTNRATILRCSAAETNHGLDIRASSQVLLEGCTASDCDQGLFFSHVENSMMRDCLVTGTGQGYFVAGGSGNVLMNCRAMHCENGYNFQKEGLVWMTGCLASGCTVCGVRLDETPTVFTDNEMIDNWVGVMAYGPVSYDIIGNRFGGSGSCALYIRDIGASRFINNVFTGSLQADLQVTGTLDDSLWIGMPDIQ